MLMMNGRFLSKEAFEMRRQFFVNDDEPSEGFLEKNKRESFQPPNPMSDPAQVRLSMLLQRGAAVLPRARACTRQPPLCPCVLLPAVVSRPLLMPLFRGCR